MILVFFLKSENVNAENSSTAPRNQGWGQVHLKVLKYIRSTQNLLQVHV